MKFLLPISLLLGAAVQGNGQLATSSSKRRLRTLSYLDGSMSMDYIEQSLSMMGGTASSHASKSGKSSKSTKECDTIVQANPPVAYPEPFCPVPAPICLTPGSSCTSGDLLVGVGESELNQPNTIACPSAELGASDGEAVDRFTITSLGGCDDILQAGSLALLSVDITADPLFTETFRLYYTDDVENPKWELVAELDTIGFTTRTAFIYGQLPTDVPTVAFRAVFGFIPSEDPCFLGDGDDDYVDRDDFIFSIPTGSSIVAESSTFMVKDVYFEPSSTSVVENIDAATFDCAPLTEGKCAKAADMCQWSEGTGSCASK